MHHLCEANGATYFHFLQPNQYVEGSKEFTDEERRDAIRDDHPYRPGATAGYWRLIEAGESLLALGVRFSDLTGVFSGVRETIYVDDCCHMNERGNHLLAKSIAAVIIESAR